MDREIHTVLYTVCYSYVQYQYGIHMLYLCRVSLLYAQYRFIVTYSIGIIMYIVFHCNVQYRDKNSYWVQIYSLFFGYLMETELSQYFINLLSFQRLNHPYLLYCYGVPWGDLANV